MEGDFHEAAVMGHDILGLSAGLDSVASLLELGSCSESIYSSGLGIDDHHDGSMIDYSIIDSGRSVLEGDLGVSHIPLDGLIPLVATHQLPTSPSSYGNARVKITSRDFVHLDGKDTTSFDASGGISSLLNDPIVSTSLSTTQLASLGQVRTPSSDCSGKGSTRLNNDDLNCFDASCNISSLLNDPIISTSPSTMQVASLNKVRAPSSDCLRKGNTSLTSEDATSFDASGNITSFLNDSIVSTSLSATKLPSFIKVRAAGKGAISLSSKGSKSIRATSNSSNSVGNTSDSTSLHMTCQRATMKKTRAPSRKSLEMGITGQLKTHGHTQHPTQTHSLKASSQRNAETAKSGTSGLNETRSPKKNELRNNFRCSMCGAVYKSHELCVNHVLDRHKPGMSIKHKFSSNHFKNTQKIHLQHGGKQLYSEPPANKSNHAITQVSVKLKNKSAVDSKIKTTKGQQNAKVDTISPKDLSTKITTVCRTIKNGNSQSGPTTNSILARNRNAKMNREPVPSNCKRAMLVLKSKSVIGPKPKIATLPRSTKLNTSIQKDCSRSKVTKQRPMKISASNDLEMKPQFGVNLKTNVPFKRRPSPSPIASKKLKSKIPLCSKTKRTASPPYPKAVVITKNKIVDAASRLQATLTRLERSINSQNDLARISKSEEKLETNADSKSGQAAQQIPSTKPKSKIEIGSETSGIKVNKCTLIKNSDTALIDSSASMPEDVRTQEYEDESKWSDVCAVEKSNSSLTTCTSAKKKKCVAITEKRECGDGTKESKKIKHPSKMDAKYRKECQKKRTKEDDGSAARCEGLTEISEYRDRTKESKKLKRGAKHQRDGAQKKTKEDGGSAERCNVPKEKKEYGDRTKGTKKLKYPSKRIAKRCKDGVQKRIKKSGGSAERVVRHLDPKQLTIVICPQCQGAFTTYTGYSYHTKHVHNISANDSPGMLKQLLVQRSPRYSSNHTATASLDGPQDSKHCDNDGDSVNVEEHRSEQVQTTETTISDSSRAVGGSSEGRLSARARETDNMALDEPLLNQDEDVVDVSNEQINEIRPDDFEASCKTHHEDKSRVSGDSKAASGTCSLLVDLSPMKQRESNQKNLMTSKMLKEGSILCSSCGVVFEDSSNLDDDHELAVEPGELVCHWTAPPEENTTGGLYLCPVCGMFITSLSDPHSHSCLTDV